MGCFAVNFEIAASYVGALTGSPDTIMDWRALSDRDKALRGETIRASLRDAWQWLCHWNSQAYGIFCIVSETDGEGRKLPNITAVRAHVVDHDGADAEQQAGLAAAAHPAPGFAVVTSPGKAHTYWPVQPYRDNDRFKIVQRKLRQVFHGDPKVIDATRVLRVPGFYHCKGEPVLVTCHALPGYGTPTTVEALEQALAHVNVLDVGSGERKPLGEGAQAPSLEWCERALQLADPNTMDRDEWIAFTAGWKQASWTCGTEEQIFKLWSDWCARYEKNDVGENLKQWRDITDSQLDWKSIQRKSPQLQANMSFGVPTTAPVVPGAPVPPLPSPPPLDCSGEYLTHVECEQYFKGCVSVVGMNRIMTPEGEFLNSAQFNQRYGGKLFIITSDGKKTDEAWKAATRSTMWSVPKVSHTRFLPMQPTGEIVTDALGRKGVNTYIPPQRDLSPGDVTPFLAHIEAMIPDPRDRDILFDWMAHIIKYPGFKIPWAPVIQSAEGAGKGVIEIVMTLGVGAPYCHFPNAQELAESGGKFNGWMRNKVFILADEIKVDEKRHMIEVLKPLISRPSIEIQSKGVDQGMEDNPANWGFFTNYQDAIPVHRNGRRYAIFFSALQSEYEILARGMTDEYFKALYRWLNGGGASHVVHWLMQREVSPDTIPMRAPKTTSWDKAVEISRSPIERVITDAIQAQLPGFKGGWISSIATVARCKERNAVRGGIAPQTIADILRGIGYVEIGRADRPWFQEDREERAVLYAADPNADIATYGFAQGYE